MTEQFNESICATCGASNDEDSKCPMAIAELGVGIEDTLEYLADIGVDVERVLRELRESR